MAKSGRLYREKTSLLRFFTVGPTALLSPSKVDVFFRACAAYLVEGQMPSLELGVSNTGFKKNLLWAMVREKQVTDRSGCSPCP